MLAGSQGLELQLNGQQDAFMTRQTGGDQGRLSFHPTLVLILRADPGSLPWLVANMHALLSRWHPLRSWRPAPNELTETARLGDGKKAILNWSQICTC